MIDMLEPLPRQDELDLIKLVGFFMEVSETEESNDNAKDLVAAALFGALARQQLSFLLKHDDPIVAAFATKFQEALVVTHAISHTFYGLKKKHSDIPSG